MNELARIVHDLATGKELSTDRLASLSPEELAALEDLQSLLRRPTGGRTDLSGRLRAEEWLTPRVFAATRPKA